LKIKRREFLGCAAAVSTAAYAGEVAAKTPQADGAKCKITVIKKEIFQDLYKKYEGREGSICSVFEVGQEFTVTSPYNPPKDFCAWAWADIRPSIHSVFFGGRKSSVVCCTDGLRPVVFNVERVEE
jgi:uncharacterized repeat protein (TIGR04076 family)